MISVGRHEDLFFIKAEHQTVIATAAISKEEAIRLRDYLNQELPDESPQVLDLRYADEEDVEFLDPSEWVKIGERNHED
jgi:hypothetical protein